MICEVLVSDPSESVSNWDFLCLIHINPSLEASRIYRLMSFLSNGKFRYFFCPALSLLLGFQRTIYWTSFSPLLFHPLFYNFHLCLSATLWTVSSSSNSNSVTFALAISNLLLNPSMKFLVSAIAILVIEFLFKTLHIKMLCIYIFQFAEMFKLDLYFFEHSKHGPLCLIIPLSDARGALFLLSVVSTGFCSQCLVSLRVGHLWMCVGHSLCPYYHSSRLLREIWGWRTRFQAEFQPCFPRGSISHWFSKFF